MLEALGYRFIHGTQAFRQFEGRDGEGVLADLDLMLVNVDTWKKLHEVAREVPVGDGVAVRVSGDVIFPEFSESPRRRIGSRLPWREVMRSFAPFVRRHLEKRRADPQAWREKYRITETERFEL